MVGSVEAVELNAILKIAVSIIFNDNTFRNISRKTMDLVNPRIKESLKKIVKSLDLERFLEAQRKSVRDGESSQGC